MRGSLVAAVVSVAILSSIAGCFYFGRNDYEDVLKKPSNEWSSRDCLTIVLGAMQSNLSDDATNIRIFATPFYPSVITAINRMLQESKHLSDNQFREGLDSALALQAGVYRDWQKGELVDSRGNYVRHQSQFDSLMFVLTLRNNGGISYAPDISDLEKRIFLVNESGKCLPPRYVWGRRRSTLEMEETLVVMFNLALDGRNKFLEGSHDFFLIVNDFEPQMKLQFPISRFR